MTQAAFKIGLFKTVRQLSLRVMLAALALELGFSSTPTLATPQESPSAFAKHERSQVPRGGLPGRRIAGGSRSSCEHRDTPLASIVPQSNLSLTTAAQPKLLFYVADSSKSRTAEFVLRDAEDQEVYSALMTVPAQSGFVTVDLSQGGNPVPLRQDENYQWYFSILCQPNNRAADLGVEGWMRPVDLGLQAAAQAGESLQPQDLAALSPFEKVDKLLAVGLWHDAMVSLSEIQSNPAASPSDRQQAQQQWHQLLNADPQLAVLAERQVHFLKTQPTVH